MEQVVKYQIKMQKNFTPMGQNFITPVPDPVTRVIVIGAGYSGITAANALRTNGIDVVVLEGGSSIGGRTRTVSMGGSNVETGGAWIHTPTGNPLSELADFLSQQRRDFSLSKIISSLQLIDQDGRRIEAHERDQIMLLVDMIEEELMEAIESYPFSQSIAELLEEKLRAIDNSQWREWARFVLRTGFEADLACSAEDISVANYVHGASYEGEDDCIVAGYSAMLHQLANSLNIHFNSIVSDITQTAEGVVVHCANGHIETGSHVVISVPLGVLKSGMINFTPELSERKSASIERLGFGAFEKLILQFKHNFWSARHGESRGFMLHKQKIFKYWIDVSANTENPILAAHITGPSAQDFSKLDNAAAIDMAILALSNAFGENIVDPVGFYRTEWLKSSLTVGAYTHLPPSISIQEIQNLCEPEGRLLFAGEATSMDRFGYVDGAYASGLREARRLINGSPVEISISTANTDAR